MKSQNRIIYIAIILPIVSVLYSCFTSKGPIQEIIDLNVNAIKVIAPTPAGSPSECKGVMGIDSLFTPDEKRVYSIYFTLYDDLTVDTVKFEKLKYIWRQVIELDTLFYYASRQVTYKNRLVSYNVDSEYLDSLRTGMITATVIDIDTLLQSMGCIECSGYPNKFKVEKDGRMVEIWGLKKAYLYPRNVNFEKLNKIVLNLPYVHKWNRLQRCGNNSGRGNFFASLEVEKRGDTLQFRANGGLITNWNNDQRNLVAEVISGELSYWRERVDGKRMSLTTKLLSGN